MFGVQAVRRANGYEVYSRLILQHVVNGGIGIGPVFLGERGYPVGYGITDGYQIPVILNMAGMPGAYTPAADNSKI
jgi:hypothetical protein